MVFVPALGADERLWQPVIDRLGDGVRAHVLRGNGASIADMADDILARAPREFYLAGISMGGYVSLDIALRGTGRVRGLALVNTSAIAAPEDKRQNSLGLIDMIGSGGFEQAADLVSGAVAPHRPDVVETAGSMVRTLGADVLRDQQLAVLDRRDRRAELDTIDVPTVILVGSADTIIPPELGAELAAGIAGAELVSVDGAGHFSPLEDPAAVAAALTAWLDRAESRSAAR
ncbi:alpha/beta fold hydrolase [Gordonia amarae]|uniref:Alpha/beta fold hydrolase n=1 Tax=Gordonia amarae TaxID=36821 RepID=A0A857MKT5_9ACTN|nr:alpha/beta fold hydrolase [Gordonia amarae]QHN24577.1 alpha/beta fold hydrolase [Gordonia amarae]QHN33505.1 alpha/beta fold hydrolase [Gordonia amarae]QHN42222.1 alpha/beta fold hydrolase [Gordonia amarae]